MQSNIRNTNLRFNLDIGPLRIRQQVQKEGHTWYYRPPKYESYRDIDMGGYYSKSSKERNCKKKKNISLTPKKCALMQSGYLKQQFNKIVYQIRKG